MAAAANPAEAVSFGAVNTPYYESGRDLYNTYCYFCHGYGGDAKTLASTYLDPKPRDFTAIAPVDLPRQKMIKAVQHGIPDTAMMSFASNMTIEEVAAVVDFVRIAFMKGEDKNTNYHTPENGWQDHQQYAIAFPFALGEIAIDTPWEQLTSEQQAGKRLFMSSCITCHDRAHVEDEGTIWDSRAISYPRGAYSHKSQGPKSKSKDALSGATPYAIHDIAPVINGLTAQERQGESLFQANCAFCHAADGTGRNWIGSFLQPHPRDLTDAEVMDDMTHARLKTVIEEGLEGTTMPAWKAVLTETQIDAIIAYVSRAFYPIHQN